MFLTVGKLILTFYAVRMCASRWSNGLLQAIKDPDLLMISTKSLVAIKDKFPKAKYHFLIVTLSNIDSIYDLSQDDVGMLREMESLARNVIEVSGQSIEEFKVGYHAKPSMRRLHLHVISRDFHSPSLKTKKHWNSFNTPFLLSTGYVIDQLMQNGSVQRIPDRTTKEYLSAPLKCNRCAKELRNMPELKEHLTRHLSGPQS